MLTINKYDNAVAFVVVEKGTECCIIPEQKGKVEIVGSMVINGVHFYLPPGKWEILFRDSEANYADFIKVVSLKKGTDGYIDYSRTDALSYINPKDSFNSMLEAHSIQLTEHQDLLILKNVEK